MEIKYRNLSIPMHPIQSSTISYIGYQDNILYIIFIKSGLYKFYNVPRETFDEFFNSDSKGSYFLRKIRPNYSGIKIEVDQ